jgi:cellulose synthase/poly-beta-1,6-N-acetylglucosamine synthase-like glycosyltransferase
VTDVIVVILTIVIAAAAAILMLPVISDALCLVRSLGRRRMRSAVVRSVRLQADLCPRLLFLVPAHNEEQMIESCVRSLRTLLYPVDRSTVVVIADNCTERTAALARAGGASCLERDDAALPGKPRAIAWALTQLPLDAHDAVIIVDADTMVDPGFGAAAALLAPLNHKVLQAYFDVANPQDSSLTRMAAVLAAANFRVAYPLKRRVGVNAPLLGNGMCIGTGVLAAYGWKAFTIAEDWELYALYTAQGVSIESVEDARLFAQEACSLRQSSTQRQRWTAGKLTVLFRHLGALLRSRRIGLCQKLDSAAELSSPGPVVHLGLVSSASVLIGLLHAPGAEWLLPALWIPIARLAAYALVGLTTQPDPRRTAIAFLFLPVYAAWRLATAVVSLKMVGNATWVRTSRH